MYAGTGPYAAILLPSLILFPKEEIHYTFMEINPLSIEVLKHTIKSLGLEDYNIKLLQEDATTYRLNTHEKYDIIISETMQNALAKEQQVPIFLNFFTQVEEDTVFIPQNVSIYLGLQKAGVTIIDTKKTDFHKFKKVFELSTRAFNAKDWGTELSKKEVSFAEETTQLTKKDLEGYDSLLLMTEIQIYEEEHLKINESGLTIPVYIKRLANSHLKNVTIKTYYSIAEVPQLKFEILE